MPNNIIVYFYIIFQFRRYLRDEYESMIKTNLVSFTELGQALMQLNSFLFVGFHLALRYK